GGRPAVGLRPARLSPLASAGPAAGAWQPGPPPAGLRPASGCDQQRRAPLAQVRPAGDAAGRAGKGGRAALHGLLAGAAPRPMASRGGRRAHLPGAVAADHRPGDARARSGHTLILAAIMLSQFLVAGSRKRHVLLLVAIVALAIAALIRM